LKQANRPFSTNDKISMDYRGLIKELTKLAVKEGVNLKINSLVTDFTIKNDEIIGIKYQIYDQIQELFPKFIICACGLGSNLSLPENVNQPETICPALKTIVTNLKLPNPQQLEFFLLDIPGVIWIFPNSENTAELGITIWTDQIKNPEKYDLQQLLVEKCKTHPVLKEIMADANFIYYSREKLPLGGPVKKTFIPKIWFIGDVMGHVGAVGGSGIISCLTMGYEVGSFLTNRLKEKGSLELIDFQECQKELQKLLISKKLKKEKSSAKLMRAILYGNQKDPKEIDKLWDKFKGMIESRPP